jgi:hypothetical protein
MIRAEGQPGVTFPLVFNLMHLGQRTHEDIIGDIEISVVSQCDTLNLFPRVLHWHSSLEGRCIGFC